MSDRVCSIEGCGKPFKARGYCAMHWWRWRHHGDPMKSGRIEGCSVEGCDRKHRSRGLCKLHYRRWQLHGDVSSYFDRTPEERFWALVDKNGPVPDYRPDLGSCWLWTGNTYKGYGRFALNRVAVAAQRVSYEFSKGPIPSGLHIDHLCRVPGCVNPKHLEAVTPGENARRGNATKLTAQDVLTIRTSEDHPKVLALRFGVTVGHIYCIRAGLVWKHLLAA